MPAIEERVIELLSDELPIAAKSSQNFGYENARQLFIDPNHSDATVLRISDAHSTTDNASPNALEEIKLQLAEVKRSAIDLAKTQMQKNAVEALYLDTLSALPNEGMQADLFAPEEKGGFFGKTKSADTKQNKAFKKQLKSLTKILGGFVDTAALISEVTPKALDEQGHKRRSEQRPTLVHEFKTAQTKENEMQFVIYQPAGRLTDRQMGLKKLQGEETPSISHATTSHKKKGLVQGNSSFVRMITGTKHADGSVTIANDSFSGPGARMPYEDLTGADSKKRMMVKATTFLNQEEIVQSLAQRIYDKHLADKTDDQIKGMLKNQSINEPLKDKRAYLISEYFKENPLSETYTQVISPSQGYLTSTDHNREQFEFVRDAIRAFDGAGSLPLNIDTKEGELSVNASYKGRHSAFGVNGFKSATLNFMESKQNTRFMNQMMDDTVKSLEQHGNQYDSVIKAITGQGSSQGEEAKAINADISTLMIGMTDDKQTYRNAMMDYATVYQAYVNAKNSGDKGLQKRTKLAVENKLLTVRALEASIKKFETKIDDKHVALEKVHKKIFNKGNSKEALEALKKEIEPRINAINVALKEELSVDEKEALLDEKSQLQTVYNRFAYLTQAQDLYYSGSWAKDEHNFELQTLVASLATELGHGNTKGCKSNNDRGQRLAQKIAGTSLLTSTSETGLYSGDYFKEKSSMGSSPSEEIDRKLTTIQTLHHTANTGVGGGKFGLRKKNGFTDNELLGKPAKLAKVGKLGAPATLSKSLLKNKGLLFGAVALAITSVFIPVVPVFVAALIGAVVLSKIAHDTYQDHKKMEKCHGEAIRRLETEEEKFESIKDDSDLNKSKRSDNTFCSEALILNSLSKAPTQKTLDNVEYEPLANHDESLASSVTDPLSSDSDIDSDIDLKIGSEISEEELASNRPSF